MNPNLDSIQKLALRYSKKGLPVALTALVLLLMAPASAYAHPGHHLFDSGLRHAVTSPVHISVLFLLGAGSLWGARSFRSQRARRVLQSAGAAMMACSAIIVHLAW